jgi:hypothetical protein
MNLTAKKDPYDFLPPDAEGLEKFASRTGADGESLLAQQHTAVAVAKGTKETTNLLREGMHAGADSLADWKHIEARRSELPQ